MDTPDWCAVHCTRSSAVRRSFIMCAFRNHEWTIVRHDFGRQSCAPPRGRNANKEARGKGARDETPSGREALKTKKRTHTEGEKNWTTSSEKEGKRAEEGAENVTKTFHHVVMR